MKWPIQFVLLGLCALPIYATTWYIRPDGGTRYSTNITWGDCDGLGDAAYPGTTSAQWNVSTAYATGAVIQDNLGFYETATTGGTSGTTYPTFGATTTDGTVTWTKGAAYPTNQHCAFNDYRYLYQDGAYANGSTFPAWGWIIAGGDTVIIRGSIGTGVSWRVGAAPPTQTTYCVGNAYPCWGLAGDASNSYNPTIPAGTSGQHTRILGENYAACTSQTARTQLHGGTGLYIVIDLKGTSYVDVQCLDLTDFSNQTSVGGGCTAAGDCTTNGMRLYSTSTNITLADIRIHGLGANGILGPDGTGFTATDLAIIGNGSAGWNADPGDGTTGVGTANITNFNISWNGCAEEYPIVDSLPYAKCNDDNSAGYGDGFGTTTVQSPAPGWQMHFDQGVVSYNTQDGLDALHLTGTGSSMTITRVLAYGNMGQQIKIGGANGTAVNNILITNCNALRQAIPGTPSGYNTNLSDFCRAADTGVEVTVGKGAFTRFAFNTIYSANATSIEVDCDTSNGACDTTSLIDFRDNAWVGYLNNSANGYPGGGTGDYSGPIFSSVSPNPFTNSGSFYSNNLTYHPKSTWTCPQPGETNAICGTDPQLTNEVWPLYSYSNVTPLTGSPLIGAGVTISGVTVDYNGTTRPSPPTIGALEPTTPLAAGTWIPLQR